MDNKNYYHILGVEKKASQKDIKKAFRALALKHHPDKNPNNSEAEKHFKLVNEANQVLSNPEKRAKYDELGENWQQYEQSRSQQKGESSARASGKTSSRTSSKTSGEAYGGQQYNYEGDANDPFAGASQSGFSDFFEQMFAGKGSGKPPNRNDDSRNNSRNSGRNTDLFKGNDYETEIEITLEEAYTGTHRIIQLENSKLRVTTKPGAYNDQLLLIKGKGAKGSSEEYHGDLFVRLKVLPHPEFTREGDDVHKKCTIDVFTAILGGTTRVHTISDHVEINIAAGTQNGKTIRLKGKGMPLYQKLSVFGDMYVHIHVQIPEKLTAQQRELFEAIQLT
jgi:curved DNA-binding protein